MSAGVAAEGAEIRVPMHSARKRERRLLHMGISRSAGRRDSSSGEGRTFSCGLSGRQDNCR